MSEVWVQEKAATFAGYNLKWRLSVVGLKLKFEVCRRLARPGLS